MTNPADQHIVDLIEDLADKLRASTSDEERQQLHQPDRTAARIDESHHHPAEGLKSEGPSRAFRLFADFSCSIMKGDRL